jgi:hypothetical protein
MFQGSSKLDHTPAFDSFWKLDNILSYDYIEVCLSIPQLIDILVVSIFWLLWRVMLWTCVNKYWSSVSFFNYVGYRLRSGISSSYGNSPCNVLRNFQMVFHCGSTVSHSYPQCTGILISPSSSTFIFHLSVNSCPHGWHLIVVLIFISLMTSNNWS